MDEQQEMVKQNIKLKLINILFNITINNIVNYSKQHEIQDFRVKQFHLQ